MTTSLSSCPKCGARVLQASDSCVQCGVIFAKIKADSPALPSGADWSPATAIATTRCDSCGRTGPVANAEFRQHIGALVVRFQKSVGGDLCAGCVSNYFWKFTAVTALVGWCGVISFFMAPIFVVLNIVNFAKAKSAFSRMAPATAGAMRPR